LAAKALPDRGGVPVTKVGVDFWLVALTVATALVFDFTNGFHDTANAMATTIATRALPPRAAVGLAALLNFAGAFISVTVAATIASGIVDQAEVTVPIIFAGLVGAILWNVATWFLGIPSSSSHALVGGVVGSVIAGVGSGAVIWDGIASKVVIPAVLAPFVCGIAAYLATRLSYALPRSAGEESAQRGFRLSQIASSSMVALAHGTNDAQKTMGVVVLTLVAGGRLSEDAGVPAWVKVSCAAAIALGTFSGGWRVIRTLGTRVTEINPPQGFSAETASSTTILASSYFGFSLSTTQTVSGGIMGAGLGRRGGVVHWSVVQRMVVAWLLTLPAAGAVGALAEVTVERFSNTNVGVTVVAAGAAGLLALTFAAARRHGNVTSHNVIEPGPGRMSIESAQAA
jgi:PiT family inorganic phosphate transporter